MNGQEPVASLRRALLAMLENASCTDSVSRDWHSATFSGLRVSMNISLEDNAGMGRLDAFAKSLPDAEFSLPGYFVADIMASRPRRNGRTSVITIDALLIGDAS